MSGQGLCRRGFDGTALVGQPGGSDVQRRHRVKFLLLAPSADKQHLRGTGFFTNANSYLEIGTSCETVSNQRQWEGTGEDMRRKKLTQAFIGTVCEEGGVYQHVLQSRCTATARSFDTVGRQMHD